MEAIGPPASRRPDAGVSLHTPGTARARPEGEWASAITEAAAGLGFAKIGFTGVEPFDEANQRLSEYLAAERHGSMAYLARTGRGDPGALLPEARTLIVVALGYAGGTRLLQLRRDKTGDPLAALASYALGPDYHRVMKPKLRTLGDACASILGRTVVARSCVDTAPLLEREAARRAGVGFIGKSCMSIIPGLGSYFVLGELIIDVALPVSTTLLDGCGRCRTCLDACPTGAFVDAYTLDARRCIAYLTIEHRGVIPQALRPALANRVFGCDVCQDVCPYNATADKHAFSQALGPRPELLTLRLTELLGISAAEYRRLVRNSALGRATRRMLQRNAAVALGNSDSDQALGPLCHALEHNPSDLVRGHAAWALGRLSRHADARVRHVLLQTAEGDPAAWVRDEARQAVLALGNLE